MSEISIRSTHSVKRLNSIVIIVDDDEGVRTALANLFRSVGLEIQEFGSASELLRSSLPDVARCMVLDRGGDAAADQNLSVLGFAAQPGREVGDRAARQNLRFCN